MLEARSIDRRIDLEPAYDYAFLRAEGLSHIQKLSGLLWTDHNLHDPGITTLEILAYALTDLAYRTGFDTRDLMTRPDGKMDPSSVSGLAPTHEVLTTAPRTVADYRRLLLRIEGLRNAWLDPMQNPAEPGNYRLSEVPIHADCLADALSYETVNKANQQNHSVKLSGLYKVLVELEIDDLLGSMNEAGLIYQVRRGPLKGAVLGFDITDPAFGTIDLSRDLASIDSVAVTTVQAGFSVKLAVTLTGGQSLTFDPCILRVIEDRPRPDKPALNITAQTVRPVLLAAVADDLVPLFWQKQQRRAQALAAVSRVLHAHRGLCEDYLSIATVTPFRVGICADIEVKPEADMELVQAQVFHAIEKYLSAPVRYHTLEEMLADGRQPDEIFNGPFIDFDFTVGGQQVFTKPGFITDEDLAASELRRKVQASDIINIVVDIDGVEAISNLQLRAYDAAGLPGGPAAKWTLAVPAGHQPVFYMEASKILFHKAGIPYRAQVTEFERTLDYLRGLDRRELYVPPDQILPVPIGRWRNPDAFYSVQHDFPATYKIGTARISDTESPERIAKARQLKGYLTFFDQILADYLGQLANLRRLYSLDKTLTRTWFSQFVTETAGSLDAFPDEFYVEKAALADETTRTRLTETEEEFLDRRNRALDHLIARFAERFADYALLSFRLSGDRLRTSAQLIGDKIDFLADYPKLSRERGQASNLIPEKSADVWNTENVSGLERRAGRLLGIDDLTRRDLACAGHFAALFGTQKQGNQFRVTIRDAGNQLLFASQELFATEQAATDAATKAYADLRDEGAFSIAESQGTTTFTMAIVAGGGTLTHNKTFDTEMAATQAARAVIDRYDALLASDLCNSEGMHLIEHILLRPRATGDRLMSVCLGEDCGFCSEEDPYSFRVSVVLPYWPERFRNLNFRALLERTLREEAPAHVQVKICWISQSQMTELDAAHRAWRAAWAAPKINATTVRNTAKRLIDILEALNTVYPAASLHDCDEGENETIVRLGSTALGIF
ncbi:MAG: hypothetical protein AB7O49_01345 [Sphingomonadales bacterium]